MFENIITFHAPSDYIENSKDILPIPSKLNIPEWFKKLPHNKNRRTIKGCIPFLDSLTSGYLLKVPTDIHFSKIKEKDKVGTKINVANEDDLLLNCNTNVNQTIHETGQVEGSPLVEKNNSRPFFKIINPWLIKTPPGYSCLFVPPLNNNMNEFEIIAGIVDTDQHLIPINFPIVFKHNEKELDIKRGSPYVQIIPFKRENWKMQIKAKQTLSAQGFFTAFVNNYKNKIWSKKRWI